jgi:cytochrome bd ubiquinol oxidase subunit II
MITLSSLAFGWFAIFVILLMGYAILDGFDLGVGLLHLFAKKDSERRVLLNSIGPVWDGNEVWLVTAAGSLLAGFPDMYATMMSSFYVPVMALLAGIILRAVAIEFRSKEKMAWWRWTWDIVFFIGSFMISFILGWVLGNLIRGIPLDEHKEFIGTFSDLIHPYVLLIGLMTVSLFMMHGAIYLLMKTEGELHDHLRPRATGSIIFFIIMYALTTMATMIFMPHMIEAFRQRPGFFIVAIINLLAVANIPREIQQGRDGRAFISSCVNIVCLLGLYAIGTYPNVIRAINQPDVLSLTVFNSSSSELTLKVLFLIAFIGIPLVLSYTIAIYYIFRGKVKIDPYSY